MQKLKLPYDEIIRDYLEGMGACAIAKKWGCSHPTILSRLAEAGVRRRKPGRRSKMSKIKALYRCPPDGDIPDNDKERAYQLGYEDAILDVMQVMEICLYCEGRLAGISSSGMAPGETQVCLDCASRKKGSPELVEGGAYEKI